MLVCNDFCVHIYMNLLPPIARESTLCHFKYLKHISSLINFFFFLQRLMMICLDRNITLESYCKTEGSRIATYLQGTALHLQRECSESLVYGGFQIRSKLAVLYLSLCNQEQACHISLQLVKLSDLNSFKVLTR